MSQMDQEQSGEVPQMCPLELEWVLPCLGTLHIKTVEKVRDSFQEGINWLASTAAVCATILNVCVRNRVGEFGRSHYIPSSSQFFFKSAKFLPAIIGSSHNFVFTISNLNMTRQSQPTAASQKAKKWWRCFCFVSPVTPHSQVTEAVSATPNLPFLFTSLHRSLSGISPPWGGTLGHLGHQWEYSS